MRGTESPSEGSLQPLAQQLDVDGRLHDVVPQSEVMRLFDHEPQLGGQTWLELEECDE